MCVCFLISAFTLSAFKKQRGHKHPEPFKCSRQIMFSPLQAAVLWAFSGFDSVFAGLVLQLLARAD